MQGLLNSRSTISSEGAFYAPAGDAKVSIVDVRDIAALQRKPSRNSGPAGKTYDIPHAAMREARLGFGMPGSQAHGLVEDYDHYRRGEAAAVTSTVRDLARNEATSFSQFAKDHANAFVGRAAGTP